ncbi:MAG: hypothetical protein B7X08_06580 [Acidocella sp. 20-63-7]|nr:MAG: hypothetical protein B7X08_06580 [Acidocella sp. 20-63-7]HQT47045.1 hypothetical protein [Acidocella sp.]
MKKSEGPVIDMTPEGAFVEPPKTSWGTILLRIIALGLVVFTAALAFWMALFILPFLLLLGLVAYLFVGTQARR